MEIISTSKEPSHRLIKEKLASMKPEDVQRIVEQFLFAHIPTKFHESNYVTWSSGFDHTTRPWSLRKIQIGAIFRKVSSCRNYYMANGYNEKGNLIRVVIPVLYLQYNGLGSCIQYEWELQRISFTEITALSVTPITNHSPEKFTEILYINPEQKIYDNSSIGDLDLAKNAWCTHFLVCC